MKNEAMVFFMEKKYLANSGLMANYKNSTTTKRQQADQMKTRRKLGRINKRPIAGIARNHKQNT
jgi:hypothetical protein